MISVEDEYEYALATTIPKLVDDVLHQNEEDTWIGLSASWSRETNDSESFKWSDDEPVKFTYWSYGEPKVETLSVENPKLCAFQSNR